jgi:signal transduction histidine kinase
MLGLIGAALVLLAMLAVFGIELSNTQAKSKRDVTARVHERAVLAGALIDSLFQTAEAQVPEQARIFGGRTVSAATMEGHRQGANYLALLDAQGNVIAASHGFNAQARAALPGLRELIDPKHPYELGNALPYGRIRLINSAVTFQSPYGQRTLITAFPISELVPLLSGELHKIPGVKGASNYLIDGENTVLGSTNPALPVGRRLDTPTALQALSHTSGDVQGHYFDQVGLSNSTWRIVLAAPNGPLFASVTGLRKWVPWAILVAFALVAIAALVLGRRALRAAEEVRVANERLEDVNVQLEASNVALEHRARELARSNDELEQFASIASHDLQEPLRKVRTFTQRVTEVESEGLSEQGRDYLVRVNGAAERMQTLIEDLLRYSRVATHGRPFVPVDLAQVAREVLEDLETQVEGCGATVSVGELPTLDADALQMRQLLQNLISNALKFRRADVAPQVAVAGVVADGLLTLTVHDNGIGFEAQYSRRIFRVFERLHGRTEYAGTGIGLALCRKIADRHGGGIAADGEPGVGSTFTVTLPTDHPDELGLTASLRRGTDTADHEERYAAI